MMEINDAKQEAIVSLIGKGSAENDGLKKGDTLSPLPSLETLSISTESTDATSSQSRQDEEICSSEFNDCSSSVSSQDSNNFVAAGNSRTVKRSVFSQYWQKTGQKPVRLRPMKLPCTSDIDFRKRSSQEGDTTTSMDTPVSNSPLLYPLDTSIASLSNAELLEDDDCDSDCESSSTPNLAMEQQTFAEPPNPSPARRRSILPPPPIANPALRTYRKSASLSSMEGYSRNRKLTHKAHSLPRMRSSSLTALQPGPSCLRPYQKYSPSKQASSDSLSETTSPAAVSPASPRILSRSNSSSSSVSFQEAVDVRHFETPRETYAGKGWSDYFS